MFEAGALSKKLETARVSPMLFGVGPTDLKGPLVHFQATPFAKEEVFKLMKSLNEQLKNGSLSPVVLASTFENGGLTLRKK